MGVYVVEFQNETDAPDVPIERLINAIHFVLARHEVAVGTTLTVVITDDAHVRSLNSQFRGIDSATDILSFPADPLPEEIEDEAPYLGDLVIAYPYTVHAAQENNHTLADELV